MNTFVKSYKKYIGIGLVLAAMLALPLVIKNLSNYNYLLTVLVNCLVFASFGVAWNVIGGYGGQISYCHSAFVAVGAYSSIILFKSLGISPWISLIVGCALSVLLATIIGRITFKYRGPFFAITTIACAEILRILLLYFNELTGGASGLSVKPEGIVSLFDMLKVKLIKTKEKSL